ncbi:MAG: class I SAM-dependent methyltransferase [Anaerolineales bacterium]|nr:class I SAM-dependent methyltransferase [Anaerolineales bacterium]
MESVTCNLCGAQACELVRVVGEQRYSVGARFRIVRCMHCGLMYLNPRPGEQEMLAYYPPEYQAAMRQVLQEVRQSRIGRMGLRIMRRVRKPPLAEVGSILDIGCASGDYLAYLCSLGWKVYGIELDEGAARYARERFGIDVRAGTAEHTLNEFPDMSFDVVTMWHVLEHLFDPSLVLAQVHRVLRPSGILMLEMPNFDSLWASVLGECWFPLEIPRHLYHFTPPTLRAILAKTGFRLTRLTGVPAPIEIIWSLSALWNRWRRTPADGRLIWSPTGVVLLYPVELLLAHFQRSTFMQAVAEKPPLVNSRTQ